MGAQTVTLLLARHALVACPWGFGELCELINSVSEVVRSVGELVTNPFLWLVHNLFPPDFLSLLAGQLDPGTADNTYAKLYSGTIPTGVAIAGIATAARVVRAVYDERHAGAHAVADTLLRFGAGTLVLAAGTPRAVTGDGLPAGWQLMRLGINASTMIGRNAVSLLSSPSVFNADVSARALVGRFTALAALSTVPFFGFFFAIILILVGVGILYMAMIMVMRSIMLAFAIAAAPMCIATAVFDHRNRFFQWWLELMSGALLIPIVLGFTLAITTGFALHFDNPGASFLPLTGVLLGGMWFTGKAVHQLTWRHFSHGGITGALTALSTTAMAVPGLAAQGASLLAAAGHGPKAGGVMDTLAGVYRGRGGSESARGMAAPLGGRAAELASAASAGSPLAAAAAASGADFTASLGAEQLSVLGTSGAHFNRVAGAAIGAFAATPAGGAAMMASTAGLATTASMAERVSEYSRQVGADPARSAAVAAETMGSLMGGRMPDLSGVLGSPLHAVPTP